MSVVIHTENLTKFYGKNRGVIDLNLEVLQGEVFGFLGPNGAGKTTTIRTLLDFIRPTRGSATIFGLDTRRDSLRIRKRTSYMLAELALYENMTGAEFLRHFAHLRGGVDWRFVQELAERLKSDISQPIHSLSRGNRQKIGLIQAFMHQPELLILDEPTSGLDPLIQREFYNMITETQDDGRTVLLSSHIMPEIERVCDRVGIIREGRLITVEHVAKLKERALRRLEIRFAAPVSDEVFAGLPGVSEVHIENNVFHCTVMGSLDPLIKAVARLPVVDLISHQPSLEEVFMTYYGGGDDYVE
jgi:ABC-2 type transport system ATP-binding protein